jgi:transposase, IS5 family
MVLHERDPQTTMWELLLPEEAKRLPAQLQVVDAHLDDERFIAPWRALFSTRLGRRRWRSTRCCACCTSSTATS